jgi:glyoxylase-like metal-dependent hydrolase (beta-lactamase superfamily II)
MAALGIELDTIDTVFISHNHLDHVGGLNWQNNNTFSLGTEHKPFPNPRTQLIVPGSMSYPGLTAITAVIGVSPHDSSNEVIEKVRETFGDAYRDIRVGEAIVIGSGPVPDR